MPCTLRRIERDKLVLKTIRQFYVYCSSREDKLEAIKELYEGIAIGQAMIFAHVCSAIMLLLTVHYARIVGAATDAPGCALAG